MSDDEDVPPLEDMSELLRQTQALQGHTPQTNSVPHLQPAVDLLQEKQPKMQPEQASKAKQVKTQTFGGMKKGFLFNNTSKQSSVPEKQSKSDDILLIKPKQHENQKEPLHMPEVQEAMKANQGLFQDQSWVTEDLLTKVQKNDTLLKGMSDPRFMQALAEFQTNPQSAMTKYQDNAEVQNFLKEFCGIMGDHFTKIADNSSSKPTTSNSRTSGGIITAQGADITARSSTNPRQPASEDDKKVEKILGDPELSQILMDTEVQKLLQCLRTDPHSAQRLLQAGNPRLLEKVKKLVDNGLLQIQR